MGESAPTLRARWRGEAGFFEIWFLVVFAPEGGRAWWFRYTTFAPTSGRPDQARATVWAAAFEVGRRSLGLKQMLPLIPGSTALGDGPGVRIGESVLSSNRATGSVVRGERRIAWDMTVEPVGAPVRRLPWALDILPSPTRVAPAPREVRCTGWVETESTRSTFVNARAIRLHLGGRRRVEQLYWLTCLGFPDDPTARLEATAVRPRAEQGPWLVPIALSVGDREQRPSLSTVFRSRVEVLNGARLRFTREGARERLVIDGWCDPQTLVGYVYRDPAGWDVYVAQSDVASCTVAVDRRARRRAPWTPVTRLTAEHRAAIEFHGRTPLSGVDYIAWDATGVD